METSEVIAFLTQEPFFGELSKDDLEQLARRIQLIELSNGEFLFHEDDDSDAAYLIQHGEVEILKHASGRDVLIAIRSDGALIGEMSLLEGGARTAAARSRGESSLLRIPKSGVDQLLVASPSAAKALLRATIGRLRETESLVRHSENMAQLGTMTAGVAHELNNPASAAMQTNEQLRTAFDQTIESERRLQSLNLSVGQLSKIEELLLAGDIELAELDSDPLERHDRAEELRSWLASQKVPVAGGTVSALVDGGIGKSELESVLSIVSPEQLDPVIQWVVSRRLVRRLIDEIHMALSRITDITAALKGQVYLGQAPVQRVDVNESIRNTLVLFKHRLSASVRVELELTPDLPKIDGYGSELNQVWTNLIANSIDAVDGDGLISISTRREAEWIIVQVQDDGGGIPEDLIDKVFDPFVTSKDVGKGTGLGLNITYNIVVFRHSGDIRVESSPGNTCFSVWLPISTEALD
ncbi:MAG: ATP-binding protein [Anaerolineales bacterium]